MAIVASALLMSAGVGPALFTVGGIRGWSGTVAHVASNKARKTADRGFTNERNLIGMQDVPEVKNSFQPHRTHRSQKRIYRAPCAKTHRKKLCELCALLGFTSLRSSVLDLRSWFADIAPPGRVGILTI